MTCTTCEDGRLPMLNGLCTNPACEFSGRRTELLSKKAWDTTCLDLIIALGIRKLGDWFGHCHCTGFCVRNVDVNVSCHKSENTIRVHSHDPSPSEDLAAVAEEVRRQISDDEEYRNGYAVRFCGYRYDHNRRMVDGEWIEEAICVYCEKPRQDRAEYLCDECLTKDAAQSRRRGVGVRS